MLACSSLTVFKGVEQQTRPTVIAALPVSVDAVIRTGILRSGSSKYTNYRGAACH